MNHLSAQYASLSNRAVPDMLRNTISVLAWAATVLAAFLRFQPLTTIGLIITLAVTQAVRVLTIFVPLKVLLLAGSERIPRYLQPFINDEQRYLFIGILAGGLVVLYALLVGLDMLSKALAHSGGIRALRRANEMALNSREGLEAPRYYTKFCTVAANVAFALVGFLVLVVIQPNLAAVSLLGILASYVVTLLFVSLWEVSRPGAATRWLVEKLSGYLATLGAANLLLGLFVLLGLFLTGTSQGVLITFLSFLILRQCLSVLKPTVTALVTLAGKRDVINPLVFRRHRTQGTTQTEHDQDLVAMLAGSARQLLLTRLIKESAVPQYDKMTLEWIDPSNPGVYQFAAAAERGDSMAPTRFEMQVFTKKTFPLAEHEEFLFVHVDRAQLQAPPVLAGVDDGGLYSRLLDSGCGKRPSAAAWRDQWRDLVVHTWAVCPPKSLSRAFHTSREMVVGRITESLVMRAALAVDHDHEAECLAALSAALPLLRERLERLPAVVHNPRMTPAAAWLKHDGGVYLADWTRWSLEPVGFGLPAATKDAEIEQMISGLLAQRKVRGGVTVADIRLIQAVQSLEQLAGRQAYKGFFNCAKKILSMLPK